jgi:nucleoside-diphosphate-sugar epimerase
MTYFVTGATGFIGRNLVEHLLQQLDASRAAHSSEAGRRAGGAREGDIHVLVREESRDKLDALISEK